MKKENTTQENDLQLTFAQLQQNTKTPAKDRVVVECRMVYQVPVKEQGRCFYFADEALAKQVFPDHQVQSVLAVRIGDTWAELPRPRFQLLTAKDISYTVPVAAGLVVVTPKKLDPKAGKQEPPKAKRLIGVPSGKLKASSKTTLYQLEHPSGMRLSATNLLGTCRALFNLSLEFQLIPNLAEYAVESARAKAIARMKNKLLTQSKRSHPKLITVDDGKGGKKQTYEYVFGWTCRFPREHYPADLLPNVLAQHQRQAEEAGTLWTTSDYKSLAIALRHIPGAKVG